MTELVEKFIPEVTHLIDRGDWYEIFQAAYESGFHVYDYRSMIEAFIQADIWEDKSQEERIEFFLDYVKNSFSYISKWPRLMSEILLKDLDQMFVGFDINEARKLIIDSLKAGKIPGFDLDTTGGIVKVIKL